MESQDPVQSGDRPQPSCLGSARSPRPGRWENYDGWMTLSSNYPSHDPGVAPSVVRSHVWPHGDTGPGLQSAVLCWVPGMVSLYITLSGLSFSDRILIDVRLNGSDDSDDSIELRNPIVVETKVYDIVFVCISLVHIIFEEGIN